MRTGFEELAIDPFNTFPFADLGLWEGVDASLSFTPNSHYRKRDMVPERDANAKVAIVLYGSAIVKQWTSVNS